MLMTQTQHIERRSQPSAARYAIFSMEFSLTTAPPQLLELSHDESAEVKHGMSAVLFQDLDGLITCVQIWGVYHDNRVTAGSGLLKLLSRFPFIGRQNRKEALKRVSSLSKLFQRGEKPLAGKEIHVTFRHSNSSELCYRGLGSGTILEGADDIAKRVKLAQRGGRVFGGL
jgi:hypothetical protein